MEDTYQQYKMLPVLALLLLLVGRSGYIGLTVRHQLIVLVELRRVIRSELITCDCRASDRTAGSSLSVFVINESILVT